MKLLSFRSALGMALVALVSACGGQTATDAPIKTAAVMQVMVAPAQAGTNAQGPTPDCAPENCQGLRIIDGNAEAFRIDAQRRAAAEANGDGPQV
jgi:hypothetical protein